MKHSEVNLLKILQDRSKTNVFVPNWVKEEKRKNEALFFFQKAKKNECDRSSTIEDLPLLGVRSQNRDRLFVMYLEAPIPHTSCTPPPSAPPLLPPILQAKQGVGGVRGSGPLDSDHSDYLVSGLNFEMWWHSQWRGGGCLCSKRHRSILVNWPLPFTRCLDSSLGRVHAFDGGDLGSIPGGCTVYVCPSYCKQIIFEICAHFAFLFQIFCFLTMEVHSNNGRGLRKA